MSTPSSDDIAKMQTNVKNMIDFNNYLQLQGNTKILNAFLLLSITDNKDLGFQIGLNLLSHKALNFKKKFNAFIRVV
jgi:hypothetical protein